MTTPLSIYVLVDALGWEVLRTRPFLDDALTDRRWLATILGYSSGAIPSLLCGRYPSEHGHWNLFYLAPERSPFRWTRALGRLPRPLVENRMSRRAIKHVSRRLSGYRGYFSIYAYPVAHLPLFDLTEKRDIYQPGGLDAPSIFDALRAAGVPYECYTYHRHTDAQILDLAPGRAAASDLRVLFLYLSGLDHYLHFNIHDDAGVTARLGWYETALRRVWDAARRHHDDVRMFVFSDHGMTPIRWTYDLGRDVATLNLRTPEDYLAAYDSTMARFWTWTDRGRRQLSELLGEHPCGQLLNREELTRLGVWFADDRYYQLLFVMKPGGLLSPSHMGSVRFAGMHGYHPSEPTADAVLLASVPVNRAVDHITGIHRVLLDDLGLSMELEGAAAAPSKPPHPREVPPPSPSKPPHSREVPPPSPSGPPGARGGVAA